MNKLASFFKTALIDPLIRSFFRFTDAIVWSVLLVILSIINMEIDFGVFPFEEIVSVCWLILPFLIFKTLLLERVKMPKYWKYLMTLVVLGLGVAYYFLKDFSPNEGLQMMRHLTLWIIGILAALVVAYFPKRENLSTYIIFLASKFFATVFYSAVLYGGLTAVFSSIEALFEVNMPSFFYMELLFSIIGLVAVPVGLGFIPEMDTELGIEHYNKIWKTVFSFIILPIVTIFSLILIVYVVTSTVNSNYYPYVYMIASLGTAVVGLLTLFVLEPFNKEAPHIHLFSRLWPFVISAIMIGFYVELIRSVIQDGFTLDNSVYLYASLWVVACTVLYVLKKYPFKMRTGQTFSSLLVTTLVVGMFFPLINIVGITTFSLNNRFERLLTEYGMIDNGEIVHSDTPLTNEQESKIFSLVIACGQVGYDRIDLLPEGFTYEDFETVFGFAPTGIIDNPEYVDLYYYTDEIDDLSAMMAENYDRLIFVESYAGNEYTGEDYDLVGTPSGDTWQLTIKSPLTAVNLAIADATEVFYDTYGRESPKGLTLYDLSYDGLSGTTSYTIYFTTIVGTYTTSTDSVRVGSFSAYIGVTFA